MKVSLSIVWDESCNDYKPLMLPFDTLRKIDNHIYEHFEGREQVRREFNQIITNFLKNKPNSNYKGRIVILKHINKSNIPLTVMYKKRVEDTTVFVHKLYQQMVKNKKYTQCLMQLHPQLFLEVEKLSLKLNIEHKYDKSYINDLEQWLKRYTNDPDYINNLRTVYKCFEENIKKMKKSIVEVPLKNKEDYLGVIALFDSSVKTKKETTGYAKCLKTPIPGQRTIDDFLNL